MTAAETQSADRTGMSTRAMTIHSHDLAHDTHLTTHILYLDNNYDDHDLIRGILDQAPGHFSITVTTERQEFERHLRTDSYDLVLSDITVPDFDSLHVLAAVRTSQPDMPVIIVTGCGSEAIAVAAMKQGASDYLTKSPDQLQQLPASISVALEAQRVQTAQQHEAAMRHIIQRAVEASHDAIIITDPNQPDTPVIYCNPAFEQMTGYQRDEIIGHNPRYLHGSATERHVVEQIRTALHEEYPCRVTITNYRKDGTPFSNDLSLSPVHDSHGRLTHFIGIKSNIAITESSERVLRRCEKLFTTMFHASPVAVALSSTDAERFVDVNNSFLKLIGYGRNEVIDRTIADLHIWADPHAHDTMLQSLHEDGRVRNLEVQFRTKDGETRYVLLSVETVEPELQEVPCMFILAYDITERKQAEEALRASETRYREITELISDSLYSVLIEADGTFVLEWGFETFHTITGTNPEELLANDWKDIIHSDDHHIIAQRMEQLSMCQTVVNDYRIVTSNGQVRWLRDHARPVWDDTQKRIVRIYGAVQEITEHKQAEERVQQNAARAEALVRVAARLNAQLDLDTVISAVCEETTRALHVSSACIGLYNEQHDTISFICGEGISPALFNQTRTFPRSMFDTVMEFSEESVTIPDIQAFQDVPEAAILANDGFRTVVCHVLMRERKLVGILVALTDEVRQFTDDELALMQGITHQAAQAITNARLFATVQEEHMQLAQRVDESTASLRIANTELARAARLKDEFLANMSHELRTPLNAILGLSEVLQEQIYGTLNDRQTKALHSIEESGRHLLALINDILDIAKIEAGKFDLDMTDVNIHTICHASLRLISQMAEEKQINIASTIDSSVTSIRADARRLKQVLTNLLSNAVKFTPQYGEIGLDVVGEPEQGVVHITVWDRGIGIAEADMPYLFQRFVQLDGSLKRHYAGTGVGLALVARMVELHGGSVTVESEIGSGSCFTVSLPWYEPAHQSDTDVPDAYAPLPTPTHRMLQTMVHQALVIEDIPLIVEQLTRYLGELNIHSIVYPTGTGVLAEAINQRPDLIILDLHIPDQSGMEVLIQLKNHPETCSIPVLLISGGDEPVGERYHSVDAYLVKPITRTQFQHALRTIASTQMVVHDQARQYNVTNQTRPAKPVILLAEDNEESVTMTQDYLHEIGYYIVVAWNGSEAIERARAIHPDLILMDIQMPELDGLEAIRRIRDDTTLASIPIIALTALAMPGDRERCLAAGANEYLSKPVRLKSLRQVIQEQLEKARNQESYQDEQH